MWPYKSVTDVIAMKANEIWCLRREKSREVCVSNEMLVSPGWECCAKASSPMCEEQVQRWGGTRTPQNLRFFGPINTGWAEESNLPPPPSTGEVVGDPC